MSVQREQRPAFAILLQDLEAITGQLEWARGQRDEVAGDLERRAATVARLEAKHTDLMALLAELGVEVPR